MPLNKLDNFIKNTEGRILYVSPADLDATDSISNQGNSLARPFKTIQRALIESARFSYFKGRNNDEVEKTTILLMPGEHIVDNRPGYSISSSGSIDTKGNLVSNYSVFDLSLDSNFDINQEDNVLYKFNSVHGGVIVPRGTSIVGLDLRKTKIRPTYVPNPTFDDTISPPSAIFRITGACYFWQFSIFDGDDKGLVYTNKNDFSIENKAKPLFSHHKLTCFEYADGVNYFNTTDELTDLDIYYAKLSNAYGTNAGTRLITERYPVNRYGFAKERPEYEIVGAFDTDPITISNIISGDGAAADNVITVTTQTDHNLSEGTPIKIRGVDVLNYNISTKVQTIDPNNPRVFTYSLPLVPNDLDASPNFTTGAATVTIETDTVDGASPYIFNVSMRSVYGMNGMHADGSKATGFRSMVVAQFTGISLQKDDRAFVKYNPKTQSYILPQFTGSVTSTELATQSSATSENKVYHLDSDAVYRNGWETTHIKITNDAILQIVSVFAIGFNNHFEAKSGGDASITNSNSNFGQLSLVSQGFKKEAFDKDDRAFITHIITPKAINSSVEEEIDWLTIDVTKTIQNNTGDKNKLYIKGFASRETAPPILTQGYRIGAKSGDKLFLRYGNNEETSASILMDDASNAISVKTYEVTGLPTDANQSTLTIGNHHLQTGEKVLVISKSGNLPDNVDEHTIYYAIDVNGTQIQLASSKANADSGNKVDAYQGSDLQILSRVSDKLPGDLGHPVQYDDTVGNWYIKTNDDSDFWNDLNNDQNTFEDDTTEATYIKRIDDSRNLDDKIYKVRSVIPKDFTGGKNPESGFNIQESSSTGYSDNNDINDSSISPATNYAFNKNLRIIKSCSSPVTTTDSNGNQVYRVTVTTWKPHNLNVGDSITIKNVVSTGYNATVDVQSIVSELEFTYDLSNNPGTFTDPVTSGTEITSAITLPRFEKRDNKNNIYIYRNEIISNYSSENKDGIYHFYCLNANNDVGSSFPELKYSQKVVDLYPQLDRDNSNDNPNSSKSYAVKSPIGKVVTNDLKKSVTKETIDKLLSTSGISLGIDLVSPSSNNPTTTSFAVTFEREHRLGGLLKIGSPQSPTGNYITGTFYNVKLYNNPNNTGFNGATATIIVGGSEQNPSFDIDVVNSGSAYTPGNYYIDSGVIGGTNSEVVITASDLNSSTGKVVQFTGDTNTDDLYYRVSAIDSRTQITLSKGANDPLPTSSQRAIILNSAITFSGSGTFANNEIQLTGVSVANGLVKGHKVKITNSNDEDKGSYLVKSVSGTTITLSCSSDPGVSSGYILKHGLSSNDEVSDSSNENLLVRGFPLLDIVEASFQGFGTNNNQETLQVWLKGSGDATNQAKAFPLGSYLQIGNEIIRVVGYVSNDANSNLHVLRGALGTNRENHATNDLVTKISPFAVEFRRPSILRASGHTFEYLGYGPGNYSTGLPQVQTRTLTEEEEYLSQSQERSGGIVVYTGMNNKGDFYIGNQKKSSATGEEITFDTPIPTVTGENPSRLSVVYDEVTIKERLVVEGGASKQILSQFDGPVTFSNSLLIKNPDDNKKVKVISPVTLENTVTITNDTSSINTTTGALEVEGGVGIGATLNSDTIICKNVKIGDSDNTINTTSGDLIVSAISGSKVAINTNTEITGTLDVTGDITAFYVSSDERLKDNINRIEDPLAKVISISGNTFEWKEHDNYEGEDTGVIAQEVEALGLPGIVKNNSNGYKSVQYHKLVPLLIEAVKELSRKVDSLEQKLQDK